MVWGVKVKKKEKEKQKRSGNSYAEKPLNMALSSL
jgi:hypothetical protein